MDVGLFCVHLLSLVDVNSLYRGRFYAWASGLCSLNREFRYIEVLCDTFYCNFGRAKEMLAEEY